MTGSTAGPVWERGTVVFVTANTFEFDSRHRRATAALAADGWSVVVVAMPGPHLPADEVLDSGVMVRRPPVERRILSVLPWPLRRVAGAVLGLDQDAEGMPRPDSQGENRVRAAGRRALVMRAYRRRIEPWTRAVVEAAPGARLFVARDPVALPIAAGAAAQTGGRYVHDVADLDVGPGRSSGMPGFSRRAAERLERRLVREAAGRMAVTPAVAGEIANRHGVERPVVVMNTREPWRPDEPLPRPTPLRYATGIGRERQVVLYQGAFRPEQGIEMLLAALDEPVLAERPLTAVFLGFGVLEDRLRAAASARPDRVVVHAPVRSDQLLEWTAGADVAFVGTPPVTLNQRLTAPNKLFEAVMAGVPVVVAAETWTARLVEAEQLGVVVADWSPEGLAAGLASVLDQPAADRDAQRLAIRRTALERLNWEVDRARLLALFRRLE